MLGILIVIGEKVSLHCMKLRFSVIFSKTIRDLQIPNMEVLDTYIRNLYANIYAPSFKAALPSSLFSCFYMFRENTCTFVRTNTFKFGIKRKVIWLSLLSDFVLMIYLFCKQTSATVYES